MHEGANSGIGLYTAQLLLQQGYDTVLACRSLPAAREAAALLSSRGAVGTPRVLNAPLDLADLASVADYARAYLESGLPLHVLVANAGIMAAPQGTTADGADSHIGVNHLGHFALTAALLPRLRSAAAAAAQPGGGRVVTVSSLASLAPGQLALDDLNWEMCHFWKPVHSAMHRSA